VRLTPPALALALAAVALTGCETTQEKSARLERVALARIKAEPLGAQGLKITTPSKTIHVTAGVVLHSSEGNAVVVTLRNDGVSGQREVPLAITVKGSSGATLYTNSTPGLATSLVSAAYVPPRGEATWVNDQVQSTATPTAVAGEVGEGKSTTRKIPEITVDSQQLVEEPGGIAAVKGTVTNRSQTSQRELVVDATVSSGGHLTGAGRAVLSRVAPGASGPFLIYLIGTAPHGAQLKVTSAPTTFG